MLHIRTTTALILALLFLGITPSFANGSPVEPDCDCPRVLGITATSTVTSATISWPTASIYTTYIVQIFKGGIASTGVYFQASTTGGSVVINGTSPATQYIANVFGVCGDAQAQAGTLTFTTVAGTATCGAGALDIGGDALHPVVINVSVGESGADQLDFEGDVDAYSFSVTCPGVVTVNLSSLSNDYDMTVSTSTGQVFSSLNPGVSNESITFTAAVPMTVTAFIAGFQHAYNTFDCYSLGASAPLPCFGNGGGGANLVSGNDTGASGTPVVKDGNLLLNFESAFQNDEQVGIQVFAVDGRVVLTESTQVFKGENQINVDLPTMDNGMYIVNLSGSFGVKSQKVVVAR